MGHILAIFQELGNMPVCKDIFNSLVKEGASSLAQFLRNTPGMPSGAVALLVSIFCNIMRTSATDNCTIDRLGLIKLLMGGRLSVLWT